ncbi:ABC transporter ATP-binding protein [Labrys wisconsinensis]|uniref:ABC-2 type transport system ATP-binding protein n=1 Tax=Labrys wisconsinensis TaxID=425677 RepID=A0ABU0JJM2_9HYPH|nr:ABC transporter ATP-binding protein [Labrys wisconsinensis]MDQ0473686.1 ABC-2 type transport system ATP-binding protein [Labrys wisconsinensis]
MSEPIIATQALTKRYGQVLAVDRLDFAIEPGEVVGLLGPNGAGKTTTILMLLGLTEPTSGQARVAGFDPLRAPLEVKRRVGYMPDSVGFYDHLSADANLRYGAELAALPAGEIEARMTAALERVRLAQVRRRPVRTFSRGMRQRLAIAEILMKRCDIAILDEPTSGLDPQSTQEFLALIRSLKQDGMTILLSSHLLDQVQSVCDRVALFNQGRVGLTGRVDALIAEVLGGAHVVRIEAQGEGLAPRLRAIPGVTAVTEEAAGRLRIEAGADVRAAVARTVCEAGGALLGLEVGQASLHDVYASHFAEVRHAA